MKLDPLADDERHRPADIPSAEWKLRVELAACYRVFHAMGWTESIFNHITLRVPGDPDTFLINPFGLNYNEVTARNLIRIGPDGAPMQPTPFHVNRAGFVIHSAVHAARADAHCVMHTHTTAGMAIACKRAGLGHDDFYGAELFGDVAYHDFKGITVHDDEGPRLVASLSNKRAMVMRNHGLLLVGSDVFNAFRWIWTLQRACEVQAVAAAIEGPDIPLTDEVRRACARDARDFEPRETLERMMFWAVLRRANIELTALV
jgi:ribulose-5-phosphate 4-epimerase/fuculose-1-phosphate aldolase